MKSHIHYILLLSLLLSWTTAASAQSKVPPLKVLNIPSTIDGEQQPVRYWIPEQATKQPTPILVSLHTWSSDNTQDRSPWLAEAVKREWVYIMPNFRGANHHPEAGGSPLARQDILDALDWAQKTYNIDSERIYLAGASGGGHMSMLMAGHHPDRFSAVSSWVGISDLALWYRFHTKDGKEGRYAQMIRACCGGPPGSSKEVDAQYHDRSPIFHLQNVGNLPVDLNTGVRDGKDGSVPIHHTLRAYNVIAQSLDEPTIPVATMDQLWRDSKLANPQPGDEVADKSFPCKIFLRRHAKSSRVTIFDGGHEAHPAAAAAWLENQKRATK